MTSSRMLQWVCVATLLGCAHVWAATLEQVISREHPDLNLNGKFLGVGRDGHVYVGDFSGYVVRFKADGTGKWGGKTPMALKSVTANHDGVIATGHVHMSPAVRSWTPMFQEIANSRDFSNSDATGWNDPSAVEAGASGDFYATDQCRNRIQRISPAGEMVDVYSLDGTGENYKSRYIRFRVIETLGRLYVCGENGVLHAITFEGKKLWTIQAPPFDGYYFSQGGSFDADDEGNLYLINEGEDVIAILGPEGKPKGSITLTGGDPKGKCLFLRLWKDDIFLKRKHATEMFQVYDRKTGEFRRAVHASADRFQVEFPSAVWIAGQPLPLSISLQRAGGTTHPKWPVQISRFNDPRWMTLPVVDGKITPPADASGLYRLRVQCGEYRVYEAVEIRVPDSRGTVSILTPLNRIYYGRGEVIPVKVIVRGGDEDLPSRISLTLESESEGTPDVFHVAADQIQWTDKVGSVSIAGHETARLCPGRYLLTARVPGFTVAPQPLVIGPGMKERSPFSFIEYTDGGGQRAPGTYRDLPENVAAHLQRSLRVGQNLYIDFGPGSPGYEGGPKNLGLEPIVERLKNDPLGVAPEKAAMEESDLQLLAAYGAFGLEKMNMLVWVDSTAPFGDPAAHEAALARFAGQIKYQTTARRSYPAFRGWDWWQHLWVDPNRVRTDEATRTEAARLRTAALSSGKWDPAIEEVTDPLATVLPRAAEAFGAALDEVAPGKVGAMSGPYRHPYVIPPITFRPAQEVDLHFQAEQMPPPQTPPHSVDYYGRPGKRAWGHPEIANEDGTGGQMLPNLLQMVMRGADGTGCSGRMPVWRGGGTYMGVGMGVDDPRVMGRGGVSVERALATMLRQYGPWLTTLEASDPLAIVVSTRMLRLDEWSGKLGGGGIYFTRLFEAYQACLYAHRPASFVHAADLKPNTLKQYKAVLIVGQQVQFDPPLAAALAAAKAAGVGVFYDETCRKELVQSFTPLGISFSRLEKDPSIWNDDTMYQRWPCHFKEHAAALAEVLGATVPLVAKVDNPEIMLTERRSGEGRFVWAVNNDLFDWEPSEMWRVGALLAHRVPQTLAIDLNAAGQTVYEVFSRRPLATSRLDLRVMPACLFAVLPKPIRALRLNAPDTAKAGDTITWRVSIDGPRMSYPLSVRLTNQSGAVIEDLFPTTQSGTMTVPLNAGRKLTVRATELISGESDERVMQVTGGTPGASGAARRPGPSLDPVASSFGPHVRDIVLNADGSAALLNTANWDDNYYLIDSATGTVRSQGSVGHHYAYGPIGAGERFFVQGYDIGSVEGYHLYQIGSDGAPERRFATYGVPSRGTNWKGNCYFDERPNNFAVAPGGSWIANAGNLGLVVWSPHGKKLWSLDWWKSPLERPPVVGQDDEGSVYAIGSARQSMLLLAHSEDTLVTLEGGMIVRAWDAGTGTNRWELKLAETGIIHGGGASADGRTLAVFSNTEGGRLFVIRDGKVVNELPVMADQVRLTADGRYMAVVVGNDLRWYATDGGVLWNFSGDDEHFTAVHSQVPLHEPRISPDGKRIVLGTCTGMLHVLDDQGRELFQHDVGAMPAAAWLPDHELLVATWMGDVMRLDADGSEQWKVKLHPKGPTRETILADRTPTARPTWGNAAERPAALTPNLLKEVLVQIRPASHRPPYGPFHALENPVEMLYDGQTTPPPKPWLSWITVQVADSGWTGKWTLNFETYRAQLRVTGITCVEDPEHPRSWMRDALLQYWDARKGWVDGPYLLSDAAIHTHHFDEPIEAAKFRLLGRDVKGWPVGNLRLGEIVFHGEKVGPSHPDAVANRPVATLFDEEAVPGLGGVKILAEDAFSGAKCMNIVPGTFAGPAYAAPQGHALPAWDFEIVEKPEKPGQYRWIQFAWKACSKDTKGMALIIGREWPAGGYGFVVGEPMGMGLPGGEGILASYKTGETVPQDWQVVRKDLWQMFHRQPVRVRCLMLGTLGGEALVDAITLGRTEADLDASPVQRGVRVPVQRVCIPQSCDVVVKSIHPNGACRPAGRGSAGDSRGNMGQENRETDG